MIRVFIVDDDFHTANALKKNIDGRNGINVVDVFYNVSDLIKQLKIGIIDIILMDINMPDIDGIEASKQIKSKFPNIKIILITFFKERSMFIEAIRLNCDGFLYKGHTSFEIIDTIKNVVMGLNTYESSVNEILSEKFFRENNFFDYEAELKKLTKREKEIVRLITEGKKDLEIAKELQVGEGYLRNALVEIRRKLSLHNSRELAVWGSKVGL